MANVNSWLKRLARRWLGIAPIPATVYVVVTKGEPSCVALTGADVMTELSGRDTRQTKVFSAPVRGAV